MEPTPETRSTKELHPKLVEILDPKTAAVIVVDIQGGYCDHEQVIPSKLMQSSTDQLKLMIPKIGDFLGMARNQGVPVVWTRMAETPESVPENYRIKMEIDDTPPLVVPETSGFDYYQIAPEKGDHEVVKNTYNAFTSTDLEEYLRDKGVHTLVVVGAYASRCVQATVTIAADDKGFNVVIPQDLVGVPDKITSEMESSLKVMDAIYGYVLSSEQITSVWENSKFY